MTRPKRPRSLSEEEITLWRAVADTVERRAGSILPEAPLRVPHAALELKAASETSTAIPPRAVEKAIRRLPPPLADLDRRTRTRIVRGRIGIERTIDLHGLTQADAHGALRRFLLAAHADDLRVVLVVTGKGERHRSGADVLGGTGVLRRAVPQWLREIDLRSIVLGFEAAGVSHGGSGALYIRLRRRRIDPAGR